MKNRLAWSLALLLIAPTVRAAPVWPTPPRAATNVTTTAASSEIDQNLTLLKGNNAPEARKLGAARLLEIGGTDAVNKLEEILQSKTPDLPAQIAVCAAIADFDHPSPALVDPLLNLLGDPRPGLSEILISALQHFDHARLVERLRPIATQRDQKRQTRMAAIIALGTTGDEKDAVATLVVLLDDPSRTIQSASLAAIAQATGIAHEDAAAARTWWNSHSQMSPADWLRSVNFARSGQVRAMTTEKAELSRRLIAAYREAYLNTPEAARTKYLQSLLADTLPAVRSLGLDLINDLITDRKEINQELQPLIVGTLTDPDPRIRLTAARMVSDLRMTSAQAKLTDALSREVADEIRAAQVASLGRLDDVSALPTLIERLGDESPLVVGEAAAALGSLVRRGRGDAEASRSVVRVLLDRFNKTPESDAELREKLLLAMTNFDAPELHDIYQREMAPDRTATVRRAAIAGLASAGDSAVAKIVRPLLSSSDAEIRLAAVDALGKCGQSKEDLDVLTGRLGPEGEPDAAIRQRAWESYLLVLQHLTPDDRFAIAAAFDLPDDKTAQRRRVDILQSIKGDAPVYDALPVDRRIDLLEQTAAAQLNLAEYAAAAANLEQATTLLKDREGPRYGACAARCVAALLKGRDDEHALQRISELTDGESINGELQDVAPLAEALREEVRSRVTVHKDSLGLEQALKLISLSTSFARHVGPDFAREISALRDQAIAKREAVIDGLLATLAGDPEAENKLTKDNQQAVLSRIYNKLSSAPTTSAPSKEMEDRLVKLARRLAPKWPGYSADATPEEKAVSLGNLRELCAPPNINTTAGPPVEPATSAPVEKKIGLHTAEGSSDQ